MDDPGIRRPPAPWSTETLTDERIATLVRERVRAAADSDRFSGVVLVAHGDSILVHEAYGYADRGTGRPVTLDTPFGVASLGKMFTGVAIAQLVAGGRLRLDDTLARVLPTYPNREAAERVTVRQLLSHTAGLPEPFLSPRFDPGHDYGTHEKLLATFADAPLAASAGQFAYSNGNYAALAAVVERLSGMSYDEYLRRNVWPPAKDRARAAAPAVGYAQFTELDPLGLEARRPETVRSRRPCPRPLGFGCGSYTADALFRFARALRTGTLVPAALVDTMTTGRVGMGGPMKYGYGFYEQRMHGVRVVGHSGSNPDTGHDADLQMVWEGDWTVIVLSNYDAPAGMQLEMQILDLLARQAAARRGGS
jgi:CubicO group peptidase (beta-lactamase class C family)